MGLESGTYISDLNANNPVNATDVVGEGDDHLRLIKATLLNTFPNVTGAVSLTHAQLNDAAQKGATNNFTGANTFTNNNTDHLTLTRNSSDFGPRIRFGNNDGAKGYLSIDDAGAFNFADSGGVNRFTVNAAGQLSAGDIPWSRLSSIPAFGTRWPTWSEVTSKPDVVTLDTTQTINGSKTFLSTSGNTEVNLQKLAVGNQANIVWKNEAGVDRFRLGVNGLTTDDLYIARYNDAGVYQDLPLSISSATGQISVARAFTIGVSGASNLIMGNTSAGVDQKYWSWEINSGGTMDLISRNDALSGINTAMTFVRGTGGNISAVSLRSANTIQLRTQDSATAPYTTGADIRHSNGSYYDVGLNVMPTLAHAGALTFARTHVGLMLQNTSTAAATWTTPASGDTSIPIGATINLFNNAAFSITVAQGSGITLFRMNGTGSAATGNRTLSQGGVATLYKAGSASWYIWGNAGLN